MTSGTGSGSGRRRTAPAFNVRRDHRIVPMVRKLEILYDKLEVTVEHRDIIVYQNISRITSRVPHQLQSVAPEFYR